MHSRRRGNHTPVLLEETLAELRIKPGKQYIDATLGDGGHTEKILKKGGLLLGIDRDPQSIARAQEKLALSVREPKLNTRPVQERFRKYKLVVGNFSSLREIATSEGFTHPSGILFDLGVSSSQLADTKKGLSFSIDAPLDMRLDPALRMTASDVVNRSSEEELYELFTRLSQEKLARPIAAGIVSARRLKPISTTRELERVVTQVAGGRKGRLHPATKVFLALRMAVNNEEEHLTSALRQAIELLVRGGRLVVISFHETEDRIVKRIFKVAQKEKELKIITKKPMRPTERERLHNPRSRSARLRAAQKV